MRRIGTSPQQRGCATGQNCPDVLELDSGDYLVIGELATDPDTLAQLLLSGASIGEGESAVIVPEDVMLAAAREIVEEGAITRVRDLHRPVWHRGMKICVECSGYAGGSTDNAPILHPCLTVQALDPEVST